MAEQWQTPAAQQPNQDAGSQPHPGSQHLRQAVLQRLEFHYSAGTSAVQAAGQQLDPIKQQVHLQRLALSLLSRNVALPERLLASIRATRAGVHLETPSEVLLSPHSTCHKEFPQQGPHIFDRIPVSGPLRVISAEPVQKLLLPKCADRQYDWFCCCFGSHTGFSPGRGAWLQGGHSTANA